MAEVWLADRADGSFHRQVAIKLPFARPGRENLAQRFQREREILARLRHPHIAALLDAGVTAQGQAWLALEYVEGQPISAYCDERRLTVRERVQIFRQVLLAVQHAHACLVIHRDLKPGNVLVTADNEVRLLDFGVAALMQAEAGPVPETELTRVGGRSMTPRYASPEQVRGDALTTACDIYSLGVVLYELLCGEHPYELRRDSLAQLEQAVLDAEVRAPSRRCTAEHHAAARSASLRSLQRTLCPELDAIAMTCMRKRAVERYTSVDALLADIDRWLQGEAVLARAPSASYRAFKFVQRHWLAVGLSAVSGTLLILLTGVALHQGVKAQRESLRAAAARDFMVDLFRKADLQKSRGADITAREMLEAGRHGLTVGLTHDPDLQGQLLREIAQIQENMGEYQGARATWGTVAAVFQAHQRHDDAALAKASEARMALLMWQVPQARQLVEAARSMVRREPTHPARDARLDVTEGFTLLKERAAGAALVVFTRALETARTAVGDDSEVALDAMTGLGQAQWEVGRHDQAIETFHILAARARGSLTLPTKRKLEMGTHAVDFLYKAGRYEDVISSGSSILETCRAVLGANDGACRELALLRLQARLRMGDGLLRDAERVELDEVVADTSRPDLSVQAAVLRLRLAAATDPKDVPHPHIHRVTAAAEGREPFADLGPGGRLQAMLALAEWQLKLGAWQEARIWLASATLANASSSGSPQGFEALIAALQGVASLQSGDPSGALQAFDRSDALWTRRMGHDHPLVSIFRLNRALALAELGRPAEALDELRRAGTTLRAVLGENARLMEKVERLQGEIGMPAQGEAARQRLRRARLSFFS